MFEKLFLSMVPVHQAKTEEERAAIFRLRYEVYSAELHKELPGADHERRWLKDPEDDHPDTVLLYAGPPEDPVGTGRLIWWPPGRIPRHEYEMLSMDKLPPLDHVVTGTGTRLAVKPSARGSLVVPALMVAAYREFVKRDGLVQFCWCAPGLVHAYRRLGFRLYTHGLIPYDDGLRVPMMAVCSDLEYFRRVHSPLVPFVQEAFGPGRRKPMDLEPFREVFSGAHTAVDADPTRVWHELEADLMNGRRKDAPFLEGLTAQQMHRLAEDGFLMDVCEGDVITRQDLVEREMYVVLKGTCSLEVDGKVAALFQEGDVAGYASFFLESGRRTGTIKALTDGRIFVLRRKFMADLQKRDPALLSHLLLNLCKVMAVRLDTLVHFVF